MSSEEKTPPPTAAQPAVAAAAKTGLERRKHPRKALRTTATLVFGDRRLPARTVDISKEGLAITADVNLKLGTDCSVSFSLVAGGKRCTLLLRGCVVDTVLSGQAGFRICLLLGSISTANRQVIETYLAG